MYEQYDLDYFSTLAIIYQDTKSIWLTSQNKLLGKMEVHSHFLLMVQFYFILFFSIVGNMNNAFESYTTFS